MFETLWKDLGPRRNQRTGEIVEKEPKDFLLPSRYLVSQQWAQLAQQDAKLGSFHAGARAGVGTPKDLADSDGNGSAAGAGLVCWGDSVLAPFCGQQMIRRYGMDGEYMACPRDPYCKCTVKPGQQRAPWFNFDLPEPWTKSKRDGLELLAREQEDEQAGRQPKMKPPKFKLLSQNRWPDTLKETRAAMQCAEVEVCSCEPQPAGGNGCDEDCVNRLLFFECLAGSCPCAAGKDDRCGNMAIQTGTYANTQV
jgi:hypothetical protein